MNRFAALALTATTVLATLAQLPAQAQTPSADRCRSYADRVEANANRAAPSKCAAYKGVAGQWDRHFEWCMAKPLKAVKDAEETWDAKLDGCMSGIEAAKTEKALADAERKAKAGASTGSYDQRWQKGLQRMADLGMTKPFHRQGFEFQAISTEAKRWGAGLQKDKQLGFYAVCDTCKGLTLRVLDGTGKVIEQAQSSSNAVDLIVNPPATGKGSVEFTVTNCQTRDDSCKVRYTSFSL